MAVFTEVNEACAKQLLLQYEIGSLVSIEGISSGIENSNFYLTTTEGRWVLTVFERLAADEIPYYLKLTRHLGGKGLPVSCPVPTINGSLSSSVKGKPASIAPCIPGGFVEHPSVRACEQLGSLLAQMHLAVLDYPLKQENTKGLAFWLKAMAQLEAHMPQALFTKLAHEVAHQQAVFASEAYAALPAGAVHADLFRNNALISVDKDGGEKLEGVIDFYFACHAHFVYDIAVTMNDWCIDLTTGEFEADKAQAFLAAYNRERALSEQEKALWPDMLRAAALRFWVSRLYDWWMPREASLLKPHDPTHFEKILELRQTAQALPWV